MHLANNGCAIPVVALSTHLQELYQCLQTEKCSSFVNNTKRKDSTWFSRRCMSSENVQCSRVQNKH